MDLSCTGLTCTLCNIVNRLFNENYLDFFTVLDLKYTLPTFVVDRQLNVSLTNIHFTVHLHTIHLCTHCMTAYNNKKLQHYAHQTFWLLQCKPIYSVKLYISFFSNAINRRPNPEVLSESLILRTIECRFLSVTPIPAKLQLQAMKFSMIKD